MIKNATEFCKLVESRLGWMPPEGPAFKRYQPMARRVEEKRGTNGLYTWRNLELAVELLARERTERNPLGVFAHVPRAIAKAPEPESEIELAIHEAMAYEVGRGDPDGWVGRFARSVGCYREQALAEWRESVR